MKKLLLIIRYFIIVGTLLIMCYGFIKRDLPLIGEAAVFSACCLISLLLDKIHGKNNVMDVILLILNGLLLIACIAILLKP